jgi:hypothetical protein
MRSSKKDGTLPFDAIAKCEVAITTGTQTNYRLDMLQCTQQPQPKIVPHIFENNYTLFMNQCDVDGRKEGWKEGWKEAATKMILKLASAPP